MVVGDDMDRHAIVAADKSRTRGIIDMPTTVLNPPQAKGGHGSPRNRQEKAETKCWYCGVKGHRESEWWKKRSDSDKPRSSIAEQGNR